MTTKGWDMTETCNMKMLFIAIFLFSRYLLNYLVICLLVKMSYFILSSLSVVFRLQFLFKVLLGILKPKKKTCLLQQVKI